MMSKDVPKAELFWDVWNLIQNLNMRYWFKLGKLSELQKTQNRLLK